MKVIGKGGKQANFEINVSTLTRFLTLKNQHLPILWIFFQIFFFFQIIDFQYFLCRQSDLLKIILEIMLPVEKKSDICHAVAVDGNPKPKQ